MLSRSTIVSSWLSRIGIAFNRFFNRDERFMAGDEAIDPMTLVQEVCTRAASDTELRGRLLADPASTLTDEIGLRIPADWELQASETSEGTVRVELVNSELPEEYLEMISGGRNYSSKCYDWWPDE